MTERIKTLLNVEEWKRNSEKYYKIIDRVNNSWIAKYPLLSELALWYIERRFLKSLKKLSHGFKHS